MKLKKNLLGAILGIASIVSCLGGALLLNESVDVNAESQTSNLIYNFAADSFSLGGNNDSITLWNSTTPDMMVDGNTAGGMELRVNHNRLYTSGAAENVSITVDLGAVYNLKHFYMNSLNRQSAGWLIYDLSVSTDGAEFTLIADDVNEYSSEYVTTNETTKTASMDIDGVGRYFRLDYVGIPEESTGKGDWMIHIYEMELYGYSLSSQGYQVNNATKQVGVEEGVTVGDLLSDLSVMGNATIQYCKADGEAVTDTTALAAEGDVIKVTDNMKSAKTAAVAGCYDAANVSFSDTYTVAFGIEVIPTIDETPISQDKVIATNINSESENGIENINDADPNNRWSSLAGRESVNGVYTEGPVDVMLDLGEEYAIYSIYIKWRSSDRIFYYNVAVSLDGGEYGEAFISFDQTMDDQFKQEMEYSVSGVSGRYIRLRITGMKSSNYIGIYELRVYGYKLTETEDFKVDNVERTIMMINENVEIASFEQAINIKGNAIGQVVKGAGNTASTVEQGDIYRISTVFGTIDYAIGMAENVQFKYAEGQEATIKVLHNSYITTVPFSGKPGKILHWYIEGTNTEWNFETDKVVSNLVLTAVWENITYTITYEGFGGSHTNVETYTVDDEITLTEATKPFSTFVGWYTDYDKMTGEFSGEIDTLSIGTIGDLKLYAKFEEIAYDVIYHDTKEVANNNLTSVKASTDSTLVEISADNFIFEGWYLDSEFTERIDAITGELLSKLVDGKLNVYAKWTAIYKISFNVNGGEPIADMEYTSKSESVILPTLKRAHYTFGGWYEDSAFTQKVESISVNAGKDYEIHAQWIPDTYTVSFYANGGTTVSDQTVAYNSKAVKPSDPVQEGYAFGGWYLDVACTQAYDFDTEITDDVCLYAKWTENVPTENDSGCAGTISILPICGLLVVALGCVLVKRKSKE